MLRDQIPLKYWIYEEKLSNDEVSFNELQAMCNKDLDSIEFIENEKKESLNDSLESYISFS